MSFQKRKKHDDEFDEDEYDEQSASHSTKSSRRLASKRSATSMTHQISDGSVESQAEYALKMEPLPDYPFLDCPVKVTVHLIDRHNRLKVGHSVPLSVDLIYESGDPVPNAHQVMTIHPVQPVINQGQITLTLTFKELSLQHGGRPFFLRVAARSSNPPLGPIDGKMSNAMFVMYVVCLNKYQLHILEHPPMDWYKDEKGASNCMVVKGELIDSAGHRILNSNIPLRVILGYDSGERLKDQTILSILLPTHKKRSSVDADGTFEVRYRVSQVSSNHQNQMFVVHIEADDEVNPTHQEISSCVSEPVRVWSKRNFHRQKKNGGDLVLPPPPAPRISPPVVAAAAAASSSTSSASFASPYSASSAAASTAPYVSSTAASSSSSSASLFPNDPIEFHKYVLVVLQSAMNSTAARQQASPPPPPAPSTATASLPVAKMTASGPVLVAATATDSSASPASESHTATSSAEADGSSSAVASDGADPSSLAFQSFCNWALASYHESQRNEWQLIGYELLDPEQQPSLVTSTPTIMQIDPAATDTVQIKSESSANPASTDPATAASSSTSVTLNRARPLYRCPSCRVIRDAYREQNHAPDCQLNLAMSYFRAVVYPSLQNPALIRHQWQSLLAQAEEAAMLNSSAAASYQLQQQQQSQYYQSSSGGRRVSFSSSQLASAHSDPNHLARAAPARSGKKLPGSSKQASATTTRGGRRVVRRQMDGDEEEDAEAADQNYENEEDDADQQSAADDEAHASQALSSLAHSAPPTKAKTGLGSYASSYSGSADYAQPLLSSDPSFITDSSNIPAITPSFNSLPSYSRLGIPDLIRRQSSVMHDRGASLDDSGFGIRPLLTGAGSAGHVSNTGRFYGTGGSSSIFSPTSAHPSASIDASMPAGTPGWYAGSSLMLQRANSFGNAGAGSSTGFLERAPSLLERHTSSERHWAPSLGALFSTTPSSAPNSQMPSPAPSPAPPASGNSNSLFQASNNATCGSLVFRSFGNNSASHQGAATPLNISLPAAGGQQQQQSSSQSPKTLPPLPPVNSVITTPSALLASSPSYAFPSSSSAK